MRTDETLLQYGVDFLNVLKRHCEHPAQGLAVLAMMVHKYLKKHTDLDRAAFIEMLDKLQAEKTEGE